MTFAQVVQGTISQSSSSSLAALLRTGPIRPILDRIVRNAADAAGLQCVVLGIRYGEFYEFIATHGIPLTHYTDRVKSNRLDAAFLAHEIEVEDLQTQKQWAALKLIPIARTWRYGGNVPIRLQQCLDDGGVLALSCADTKVRKKGGNALLVMRGYTELISDLIWLSSQIERASVEFDAGSVVRAVLEAGLAQINIPVCIINEEHSIVAFSRSFANIAFELGSSQLESGQTLSGRWFAAGLQKQISESFLLNRPRKKLPVTQLDWNSHLIDVFPFSFAGLGKFGVLAFNDRAEEGAFDVQQVVWSVRDGPPSPIPAASDGNGPVSQFLTETLVNAQRLYRRLDTTYIGLRRWRTPIKSYQIAALRALKSEPPDAFVSAVAKEMATAIRSVYGAVDACVVVPVPCGSSGADCLSCRLSTAVAAELGIPHVQAFDPISIATGKSHPRRNIRRPQMKLARTVCQPVILIDDVATSGSHMDEAATLLRLSAPQVWPIAWIAS